MKLRGQRVWLDYVKEFADETFSDAMELCCGIEQRRFAAADGGGARRRNRNDVNYINDEGFIYVRSSAASTPPSPSPRVVIHTRKGGSKASVGNVAPHLTKGDKERKLPQIHDLFIDIGAAGRKEAESLVRVGDPITLEDEFELLRNGLAIARAFDNRIGTFAVAEDCGICTNRNGG